jgi:hypothetical protein
MKVTTTAPILFQNESGQLSYSNASGSTKSKKDSTTSTPPKTGKDVKAATTDTKAPKEHHGFFSKEKMDARKAKRETRRSERKAKYGARPLKKMIVNGVHKFKDALPKIRKKKKADGTTVGEKTMPDGSKKEIPLDQIHTVPSSKPGVEPTLYDKKDVATSGEVVKQVNPTTGEVDLSKTYTPEQTEAIDGDNGGEPVVYKKEDVIDKDAVDAEKPGMSSGMKTTLIVGGIVIGVAIVAFIIYKSSKSKAGSAAPGAAPAR